MKAPAAQKPAAATASAAVPLADRGLFWALVALLGVRPLIGESYERLDLSFLALLPAMGGPTPATTAWLDTLLLAAAALALLRCRPGRTTWPMAVAVVLLAASVAVSCIAAADRHAATFMGSSLIILVLAGVALHGLLRARWMWHVLVATLLASGAASAVKCALQVAVDYPETRRAWEQEFKPQLIAEGADVEAPHIVNYERRLRSGEATGYLALSNITGSCLAMWLLVTGGLLIGGLVQTRRAAVPLLGGLGPVLALTLASLLTVALWLTDSLGALGSATIGAGALLVLGSGAPWVARRSRTVVAVAAAGYVAVIGAVAAFGVQRGTLPHPSLAFRWYYWTAAVDAWREAPLTGLGRGNFGPAYLRHKSAASTEEVKDPHNLWVSLLVELGPLGLMGGAALVAMTLTAGLQNLMRSADRPPAGPRWRDLLVRAAPVAGLMLILHLALSGLPFTQPGVAVVWGSDLVLAWLVALAVVLWLVQRIDSGSGTTWIVAGTLAALAAELVHSLLDFTLMTPGGLAVFVLCAVAACGTRPAAGGVPAARRWPLAVLAGGAIAAHAVGISGRIANTERALAVLDKAVRGANDGLVSAEDVHAAAAAVLRASPGDASAARVAGRALYQMAADPRRPAERRFEWLAAAEQAALAAGGRMRADGSALTLLARIRRAQSELHAQRGEPALASAKLRQAAADWNAAVALYPTDPRTRISAGAAWLEVWRRERTAAAAAQAVAHLRAALAIDDCRPTHEVLRLRAAERAAAEQGLAELGAAEREPPP